MLRFGALRRVDLFDGPFDNVHLPSASRIQRVPFRYSSDALYPLFSAEVGLHVPARAFSSFLRVSRHEALRQGTGIEHPWPLLIVD